MPPKKKGVSTGTQLKQDDISPEGKHSFQKNVSIYGCSSHSNTCLRLKPLSKIVCNCRCCGVKLSGQTGYLECPVKNCFYLCSTCKICRNNHLLGRVYGLGSVKQANDGNQNTYKCNVCKQQKEVDVKKGFHLCPTCSYCICPECIRHEDDIWMET